MSDTLKIGFLGAGKMASALAKGFIRAGLVSPGGMLASDPSQAARAGFEKETGAATTTDNRKIPEFASVLVLAVKPDQVVSALSEIRGGLTPEHLLISIAAGVTLAKLEGELGPKARVIRVMPNTPALVGASACPRARSGSPSSRGLLPGPPRRRAAPITSTITSTSMRL